MGLSSAHLRRVLMRSTSSLMPGRKGLSSRLQRCIDHPAPMRSLPWVTPWEVHREAKGSLPETANQYPTCGPGRALQAERPAAVHEAGLGHVFDEGRR